MSKWAYSSFLSFSNFPSFYDDQQREDQSKRSEIRRRGARIGISVLVAFQFRFPCPQLTDYSRNEHLQSRVRGHCCDTRVGLDVVDVAALAESALLARGRGRLINDNDNIWQRGRGRGNQPCLGIVARASERASEHVHPLVSATTRRELTSLSPLLLRDSGTVFVHGTRVLICFGLSGLTCCSPPSSHPSLRLRLTHAVRPSKRGSSFAFAFFALLRRSDVGSLSAPLPCDVRNRDICIVVGRI